MSLADAEAPKAVAITQAIAAVKAFIEKGDHASDKAEQYYKSAGQHLEELKEVEAHKALGLTWAVFVKEKCGIGRERADELIRIADGRTTLAAVQAQANERKKVHREKQSVFRNTDFTPAASARNALTVQATESSDAEDADAFAARGRALKDPSKEERNEQHRREALKDFKKWHARWNGLVPELDKLRKSIAAIEVALSGDN